MDDVLKGFEEFLNSEEGKNALSQISAMFEGKDKGSEPDLMSSVQNVLQNNGDNNDGFIDPKLLGTIMGALGKTNDNKSAALISALKPYLSGPRQHKADEAIKLLKLLKLLPILKESGIISEIL